MEITAHVSSSQNTRTLDFQNFIVETFYLVIRQFPNHNYVIIVNKKLEQSIPVNTKIIFQSQPPNALFKKLWWDVKLPATLKKLKTDLFISFEDRCSLTASIPQVIIVDNAEKIKASYIKKAQLLIVNSQSAKRRLMEKHKLPEEKISIIYPSAGKNYKLINAEEKELALKKFSDGKEYFLYNSSLPESEKLVDLLKSFSHFKKRQQSSFKLLLAVQSTSFEKELISYKYRNDIKFVDTKNEQELALITSSAYAIILPFNSTNDLIPALNAMQAGIPVIVTKDSVINEVAEDAALYAETDAIKDIGEKMMQVYTDENHRSVMIKKGIERVGKLNQEKAIDLLWQAINTTLK